MVHGGSTIPNHTRAWWPPLLSSTSITHLPEASPRSFSPTTRYLAEENTVIQEIWKSIWNLNLRPKRISGLVDIPLPRLPISPHPPPLVNVGTERRIPSLPPHDVFFPGWRMHIKASIRTRCYADLNLRRSSCAVYHRNLLPYWVSRAVARMWDVWRSRIPQSQFKEAPISSPNIGSKPGGLFACTDLLMGEEIPLCLCFAYNWLYFISLHTAVISNHRCFILPATNIKVFKSKSHALRKSIKVVCTKITIVTVTFCVQSFFWYLSKQAPFCDEWCPDSVFFGKQNKSISWYISGFLWRLTEKDVFLCKKLQNIPKEESDLPK